MYRCWFIIILAPHVFTTDTSKNANITTLYPTNQTAPHRNKIPEMKNITNTSDASAAESAVADLSSNRDETQRIVVADIYKEFRPSVHLGDYEDNAEKEEEHPESKHQVYLYKQTPIVYKYTAPPTINHITENNNFPYAIENPVLIGPKTVWNDHSDSTTLQHHPGFSSLYPSTTMLAGEHADFEHKIKAYESRLAWKRFFNLVSALVPVGLIVSALTPNVINLQQVPRPGFTAPRSRRDVDDEDPGESCKRLFLCQLQYIHNMKKSQTSKEKCSNIHCPKMATVRHLLRLLQLQRLKQGVVLPDVGDSQR